MTRPPAELRSVGAGGKSPPAQNPPASLSVLLCSNGEDVASDVRAVRAQFPDATCLTLCPRLDLGVARAALKAGARGFLHAGTPPEQLARALKVASRGELVVPRGLLELLMEEEAWEEASLQALTAGQREVLGLVGEGLSNAQISGKLFLSESTVKQRLSAAYKTLRVKNRAQAAQVFRRSNHVGGG